MFSDSRDWKSIDDFEKWNLSQVKALAKYRKGEGDFDYDFYEEVYENLKKLNFFLDGRCKRLEALDNHYWWAAKDLNRSRVRSHRILRTLVVNHGVEYFIDRYELLKNMINLFDLQVSQVTLNPKPSHFGTRFEYEYLVCSRRSKSDKEKMRNQIKNMESLRETYPFKLKHLPTFSKIGRKIGLEEISSMGGGAVQGHVDDRKKELDEMYSSAAIMGSGGGGFPKERSPEGHKRYVRIRFKRQGLQNFKPNRYFRSKDQQLGEKKDKKGASKSYCESTPCKDMGFTQKASCKSQGIKDCYRGKKKN